MVASSRLLRARFPVAEQIRCDSFVASFDRAGFGVLIIMLWSDRNSGRSKSSCTLFWWNRPLLDVWAFECERASAINIFHAVLLGVGLIALVTTATLTMGQIDQFGKWFGLLPYDWWLVCAGVSSWGSIVIVCLIARLLRGERRRFPIGLELLVVGVAIFVLFVFGTSFMSSVVFDKVFVTADASNTVIFNNVLVPVFGVTVGFMWSRLLVWAFAESFVPNREGFCGVCGFDLRASCADLCVECGNVVPHHQGAVRAHRPDGLS